MRTEATHGTPEGPAWCRWLALVDESTEEVSSAGGPVLPSGRRSMATSRRSASTSTENGSYTNETVSKGMLAGWNAWRQESSSRLAVVVVGTHRCAVIAGGTAANGSLREADLDV
jgi:hypothetical protein